MDDARRFFDALDFRYEWRKYQRLVLDLFEQRDPAKRTFHVVAPPGSGKTLVGIEIARRLGTPAITFSPTTTIQEQWRDKVELFIPDGTSAERSSELMAGVSTDPSRLGVISSLTYQSLSTQTQEREFLVRLGRSAWLLELVEEGGRDDEAAEAYLTHVLARSEAVFQREVARRAIREKRRVLASGEANLHDLLHPNAINLVDRIVAAGTGCLLLDEAHHLLDYWALILGDLIARLPNAVIVGLTATPPASADPDEMANYLRLVNGIDFEVPTPAVVRSGFLAPYQDLVVLTRLTADEREFLARHDELLHVALDRMEGDERFDAWLTARINRPAGEPAWERLLSNEFEFAVAGVRQLVAKGTPLADDIDLRDGLRQPPTVDDRLAILRTWCLEVLRFSEDAADAEALADLRALLRTLGMVMTETGWRRSASPLDRVLAYSDSKLGAMLDILRTERSSIRERLRAVVLTDHERAPALATRQLRGVLDAESGGAVRAMRALVGDPETLALHPIMVTGRTVLVAATWAADCLTQLQAFFAERGLHGEIDAHEAEPGIVELSADGSAWRPRYYVAAITDLLERGITQCIVGTRGLLAEGWDSLTLNTLIDLTTAGTYASVNQIRGRSIRLDPNDPHKVANNWDVVAYEPDLEEGERDLQRLIGKHIHSWGLGPGGRILRGIAHVDERIPLLGMPLPLTMGLPVATPDGINRTAMRRARNRPEAYRRWGIGTDYDNFIFTGTILERPEKPPRTAFTWAKSLRALLNIALMWLVYYAVVIMLNGLAQALALPLPWNLVVIAGLVLAPIVLSAPFFWRYARAAFIDLPVDSFLADFGRAVAEAYRSTGLAPMSPDQVRVRLNESGTYDVVLDNRDKSLVDQFARSYRELFEPIVDQRYLVHREEAAISGTFYAPIWYVLRTAFRVVRRRNMAYHALPSAFARRRELADEFAAAWKRWVGGGELVYTRSPAGMEVLMRERISLRRAVRTASFEEWR
jgi:superfamily II DNA or RNA helicase